MIPISQTQQTVFSSFVFSVVLVNHSTFLFNAVDGIFIHGVFYKNQNRFVRFCHKFIKVTSTRIKLNSKLCNEILFSKNLRTYAH